ncbi:hypothetical protein [Sulfitobacter sp. MF3-043]|uniref:hypothetical protein n=1 Tax=Sulfitobacter sediminivivens TaxID=3252902 RepID=UPI0036D7EBB5
MGSLILSVARVAVVAATAMLVSPAWTDDLLRQVQDMLYDFLTEYGFPGATVAYVLPDGSSSTVATGLADVEAAIPMKGFYTFGSSAHSPLFEEVQKTRNILRQDVLAHINTLSDPILLDKSR